MHAIILVNFRPEQLCRELAGGCTTVVSERAVAARAELGAEPGTEGGDWWWLPAVIGLAMIVGVIWVVIGGGAPQVEKSHTLRSGKKY